MPSPLLPVPSYLENTVIGLVGLGREGWSTYRYLRTHLPTATIWAVDDRPLAEMNSHWTEASRADSQLTILTTAKWLQEPLPAGVVFKTPGLPPHHPLSNHPALATSAWSSNLQLLLELVPSLSAALGHSVTTIGVTGTKGKSTTTSMIHHVLRQCGRQALIGGNIGKPALDLLTEPITSTPLILVLEMSCHQLSTLPLSPNLAVIQNIVPEHLDYYPDFATYLAAKSQIARYQTEADAVIYNPAFGTAAQLAGLSPGQHWLFSTDQATIDPSQPPVASIHDDQLWIGTTPLIPVSDLPLPGHHNWENVLPAVVIATQLGCKPEQITSALLSFQGLPHRLETVGRVGHITYYNDSLSTVPEATLAALAAVGEQPTVLLAGGYERHQDFQLLAQAILDHQVIGLVLFGQTGPRLWDQVLVEAQARRLTPAQLPWHTVASNMVQAVSAATQQLQSQLEENQTGVVLLSPASPSFGQFKDYADRGNQFAQAVHAYSTT